MRARFLVAALICAAASPLAAQAPQPAAIPVGTQPAAARDVTSSSDFVGRIEAMERVDIRARVTGFLQEVAFKEGAVVHEGDVLYRIEPDSFQAAETQARGTLVQAQAHFANASAQRYRTEELVKTNAAARATLDERIADEKTAQGEIITADAALKTASINLGYTTITSPITGEVGRSKVTRGNLIGPDSGVLTTVVSRDPMYVTFPVSQRELLLVQADQRQQSKEALTVRVRFSDGTVYGQTGKINFIDVTVDRATDTVLLRATIANPDGALIDGQLVQVAVEGEKPEQKIVVPQSALIVDQQGPYVFVVQDGKAVVRRLKLAGALGTDTVVDSGLTAGDLVVVQGMENLRPGMPVQATPAAAPAIPRK